MEAGRYMAYSPSPSTGPHSPHPSGGIRTLSDHEKYLSELLGERQKLGPFMPVLPHAYRLLNHEILRVTTLLGNGSVLDQPCHEHPLPLMNGGLFLNGEPSEMNGWASSFPSEEAPILQPPLGGDNNWLGHQSNPTSGLVIKKTMKIEVPVDQYPNYNFVGRLLGPRGNSLKRVEATTDCRVLIRGRGSIKDTVREEMLRGKPGYEHLNEPLHIVIEAELPVEIIDRCLMQARDILEDLLKPVDESMDFIKKQQLRELAMLNGTLREDSSQKSGSISPFHNNNLGMKRAKTRG